MTRRRLLPDVDLESDDVRDSLGRRITEEYAQAATAQALASVGPGALPDRDEDDLTAGDLSSHAGAAGPSRSGGRAPRATHLRRGPRGTGALSRLVTAKVGPLR
jgi:hypothetical protein